MSKVLADVQADSSTPTEQQSDFKPMQQRVDTLTGKARDHYWQTGDIDAAEALSDPAPEPGETAESPTAPAETEIPVKTETASAPVKQTKETQDDEPSDPKQRHNWRQLRSEKARLEGQLEEARRQIAEARKSAPGTSETAKPDRTESASETLKRPEFPDIRKFKDEETFDAAVRQWQKDDTAWMEARLTHGLSTVESSRHAETAASGFQQRQEQARAKYKDFDAVAFKEDTPASVPMLHLLYTRKDGTDLLYHLGKNPEAAAKITELTDILGDFKNFSELDAAANRDPKLARELGEKLALARIEFDRIAEGFGKPAVPLKIKTKQLPKPTGEVAVDANSAPQGDELEAAIKAGDQEAFNRIANRRAVEAARNGG